jgi:hypothetical protein
MSTPSRLAASAASSSAPTTGTPSIALIGSLQHAATTPNPASGAARRSRIREATWP